MVRPADPQAVLWAAVQFQSAAEHQVLVPHDLPRGELVDDGGVPAVPGRVNPPAVLQEQADWHVLIREYVDWDWDSVERIIECESHGHPDSISGDGANWGLGQINLVHQWRVGGDPYALLDPATNIRVMHDIWLDNGGFSPWACY